MSPYKRQITKQNSEFPPIGGSADKRLERKPHESYINEDDEKWVISELPDHADEDM